MINQIITKLRGGESLNPAETQTTIEILEKWQRIREGGRKAGSAKVPKGFSAHPDKAREFGVTGGRKIINDTLAKAKMREWKRASRERKKNKDLA